MIVTVYQFSIGTSALRLDASRSASTVSSSMDSGCIWPEGGRTDSASQRCSNPFREKLRPPPPCREKQIAWQMAGLLSLATSTQDYMHTNLSRGQRKLSRSIYLSLEVIASLPRLLGCQSLKWIIAKICRTTRERARLGRGGVIRIHHGKS